MAILCTSVYYVEKLDIWGSCLWIWRFFFLFNTPKLDKSFELLSLIYGSFSHSDVTELKKNNSPKKQQQYKMNRDCVSLQHVQHMAKCFHFDFATHMNQIQQTVVNLLFSWLLEMLFGYFIEQTNNQRCQALLFSGCNFDSRAQTHMAGTPPNMSGTYGYYYYGFGYCYSKSVNRNENHHTQIQ